MTRRNFLEGDNFARCQVFGCHKFQWTPIKDKVKSWIKEGWATWEEEKPDWFTDQWKASVPEDMKPAKKKTGKIDDEDKTAEENEVEEALMVGGGEEQKGRRRSVLEVISGQKAVSSKVMPAGGGKKEDIDAEDFVREMNRRGSMSM